MERDGARKRESGREEQQPTMVLVQNKRRTQNETVWYFGASRFVVLPIPGRCTKHMKVAIANVAVLSSAMPTTAMTTV